MCLSIYKFKFSMVNRKRIDIATCWATNRISAKLVSEEKVSEELAMNSAKDGFEEVERLLANHSEAV